MNWRPSNWKNPYDLLTPYRAKIGATDETVIAVTDYQYSEIVRERQECFEAGADALLEALKTQGLKVSNISLEHTGKGILIFIPDEEGSTK